MSGGAGSTVASSDTKERVEDEGVVGVVVVAPVAVDALLRPIIYHNHGLVVS